MLRAVMTMSVAHGVDETVGVFTSVTLLLSLGRAVLSTLRSSYMKKTRSVVMRGRIGGGTAAPNLFWL